MTYSRTKTLVRGSRSWNLDQGPKFRLESLVDILLAGVVGQRDDDELFFPVSLGLNTNKLSLVFLCQEEVWHATWAVFGSPKATDDVWFKVTLGVPLFVEPILQMKAVRQSSSMETMFARTSRVVSNSQRVWSVWMALDLTMVMLPSMSTTLSNQTKSVVFYFQCPMCPTVQPLKIEIIKQVSSFFFFFLG